MSTSETPPVSIIIPCYNAGKYLREAIESALNQTYPNIELILVNDGSTDNSEDIARSYGSKVKLINQPNSGLAASRNMGIWAATTQYHLFLDADDVLAPNSVERRMKILLSDPTIGCVVGDCMHGFEEGPKYRVDASWVVGEDLFFLVTSRFRTLFAPLYRREVFIKCGFFDPFIRLAEDIDHHQRYTLQYRIGYDPEIQGYYRNTPESLSKDWCSMYIYLTKIFKKNSVLTPKKIKYWFATQRHLTSVTKDVINSLRPKPFPEAASKFLKLALVRPLFLMHFTLAVFKRIFRIRW
jgi:glycosyltransferase involved in cell wall biosynthesis